MYIYVYIYMDYNHNPLKFTILQAFPKRHFPARLQTHLRRQDGRGSLSDEGGPNASGSGAKWWPNDLRVMYIDMDIDMDIDIRS